MRPIWQTLEICREYRKEWRGNLPKTYSEMIDLYTSPVSADANALTPQQLLLVVAQEFREIIKNPADEAELEEATWGLQETLNEYMTGQLLLGNDYLVKGLRARFPIPGDPTDMDPLTYLDNSEERFHSGILEIVEDLRGNPETMRSGNVGAFPIFVYNSKDPTGDSLTVENEMYRFTNLVERNALASNSKGKKMFFYGNVNDVDNFPFGNFPGEEDLDFNGDGEQNEGGRKEAAIQLKKSAHSTYLHTAVLAAVQSSDDFNKNNGYQLKRQIKDAQVVFEDIKSGLNPLDLLGDFIPYQPVENFLRLASDRIDIAAQAETAAKGATRLYDGDKETLAQTLRAQRENYENRIQQLTGVEVNDDTPLVTTEDVEAFMVLVEAKTKDGKGELGIQKLSIDETLLSAQRAAETLKQVPQRIANEMERTGAKANIIMGTAMNMSALSFAEAMASGFSAGTSGGYPSFTWNPEAVALAGIKATKDIISGVQSIKLSEIKSEAVIKNLLFEQATAYISLLQSQKIVEREKARLEQMKLQLMQTIGNYKLARDDMAEAYYSNPAYRLDRDQLIDAAETSFETAMTESYYAAKALEYLWSEKYNNPVPRMGGGIPESLSASYDPYVRAESVFTAHFAGTKSPNLRDFLSALQAWDLKMRQLRGPMNQTGTVLLSMREDLLGYNGDKAAFKNFISENRVKGENANNEDLIFEFVLNIGNENLFPAFPNLKIREIRVNLVSDAARSIRSGSDASPAYVDLVMLDEAVMRTFFADYPTDDDVLTYSLESGRTLEKSPFIATIESTIDGYAYPPATTNVQLADHSPACTRWVFRMKMNRGVNQELLLNHLEDIELQIGYQYGKPRDVGF